MSLVRGTGTLFLICLLLFLFLCLRCFRRRTAMPDIKFSNTHTAKKKHTRNQKQRMHITLPSTLLGPHPSIPLSVGSVKKPIHPLNKHKSKLGNENVMPLRNISHPTTYNPSSSSFLQTPSQPPVSPAQSPYHRGSRPCWWASQRLPEISF